MLALRQEALQLVNELPENLLAEVVQNLRDLKKKFADKNKVVKKKSAADYTFEEKIAFLQSLPEANVDPKKKMAMAEIAKWQERNKDFLNSEIDWDNERAKAMEEKYGTVD